MDAIRPNKNFDNERREHVSYEVKMKDSLKNLYDKYKKPEHQERYRAGATKDSKSSKKWFGL